MPSPCAIVVAGDSCEASAGFGFGCKDSTIREYRGAPERYIRPAIGARRLSHITHADILDLVDELQGNGLAPSSIRNTLDAVGVIYRRALARAAIATNPGNGLELPTGETRRERAADPVEPRHLIAALERPDDQALWACALFAGLRSGELRALEWQHIRLGAGMTDVRQSMDRNKGITPPKTKAGVRSIPIAPPLHGALALLKALRGGLAAPTAFVVGSDPDEPRGPSHRQRCINAPSGDGVEPALSPSACTSADTAPSACGSTAGIRVDIVSEWVGHASVAVTADRYRHLLVGADRQAADMFAVYLERSDTTSRIRQLDE